MQVTLAAHTTASRPDPTQSVRARSPPQPTSLSPLGLVLLLAYCGPNHAHILSATEPTSPQASAHWKCDFLSLPSSGCRPGSECHRGSDTCLCGPSDSTALGCLPPVDLGQECHSSGQCAARVAHSACFGTLDATHWTCTCEPGFRQKGKWMSHSHSHPLSLPLGSQCKESPIESAHRECPPNQVWLPLPGRCVFSPVHYAHRGMGRVGGGRGGGGARGGVGGRSVGSRAWQPSDRNTMRKNVSARDPNSTWQVCAVALTCTLLYGSLLARRV